MLGLGAIALASGGGIGALNLVVKGLQALWSAKRQNDQAKHILTMQHIDKSSEMIAAQYAAETTNGKILMAAIISRAFMLFVSIGVLVAITVYAAMNPDSIIYYPETNEPWSINLMGLIEFKSSTKTEWREFVGGVPVFPIWMTIIGANIGLYLSNAMVSRLK